MVCVANFGTTLPKKGEVYEIEEIYQCPNCKTIALIFTFSQSWIKGQISNCGVCGFKTTDTTSKSGYNSIGFRPLQWDIISNTDIIKENIPEKLDAPEKIKEPTKITTLN